MKLCKSCAVSYEVYHFFFFPFSRCECECCKEIKICFDVAVAAERLGCLA